MIRLCNVSRQAGSRVLLRDVSLDICRGDLVAIAGPSGAGKSTLLNAIAEHAESSARVGFVPQEDIIHRGLTLRKTLRYAARLRLDAGRETIDHLVDEALRRLHLDGHGEVPVGSLSGGQRKRASIAVELLGEPEVCLLDEPTSGLDPVNATGVMQSLRDLTVDGMTVVMTTHDPSQLDKADRIVFVAEGGRLAFEGTPSNARAAFGVNRMSDVYPELTSHVS